MQRLVLFTADCCVFTLKPVGVAIFPVNIYLCNQYIHHIFNMTTSLGTMVETMYEEKNWLCVISSDVENKGVDINDDCSAMMEGECSRFFVFDVSGGRSYAWISVAGALEEGSKVMVLHLGTGDPPFPNCASLTCSHPVPQDMSYEDHIHQTFGEIKGIFSKMST